MAGVPQQTSLFAGAGVAEEPEVVVATDGDVRLYRYWWAQDRADDYFQTLYRELAWQASMITIHGRRMPVPRLNVWYGDAGRDYEYSGIGFRTRPWSPALTLIKEELEHRLGLSFNSVLANLYRDGRDSVAWHSDNEPELGHQPTIASLSLGAERRFSLRHKVRRDLETRRLDLPNGSLLLMAGTTQRHWQHQLSKTVRPVGARINLTFRNVWKEATAGSK